MSPRSRTSILAAVVFVGAIGLLAPPAHGWTNAAVFNFQMQSDTPDWSWLQKGLADALTTDLVQGGTIRVIARDAMQAAASRVQWRAEMAMRDEGRMGEIQRELRIDHLVTGTYAVRDGTIEITAQIVDVASRREVCRRTVQGPEKDVLTLQKQLSAELLGWFANRPPAEILKELPVWTRSVPAARALYEGMDRYDQGRYGEAWLRFRQAVRNDPGYIEAEYWVGRMYYFMDRYAHARSAYERFVYQDAEHPRIGDAIKEYLHTYEKLHAPPQTLLDLYADLAARYPKARIHGEMGEAGWVSNRCWLWTKSAIVLGAMGRHKEATELAAKAEEKLSGSFEEMAYTIAYRHALLHNALTGEVVLPEGLAKHYGKAFGYRAVRFAPGQSEVTCTFTHPATFLRFTDAKGDSYLCENYPWWFLAAPDGHVFTKLTIFPTIKGNAGNTGFVIHKDVFGEVPGQGGSIEEICERGVTFARVPRSGLLQMNAWISPTDPYSNKNVEFSSIRVLAEFERLGECGGLDVRCTNAANFRVLVDGELLRSRPGIVGHVTPGAHTLTVEPRPGDSVFGPFELPVEVRAGEVTPVQVTLPRRAGTVWDDWSPTVVVALDTPDPAPSVQRYDLTPVLLLEEDAIRLVWPLNGDLWTSCSTDTEGTRFSPPRRLELPVSSGWTEQNPVCLRDESGRYILAFRSDRNAQRDPRPYLCWSRDFRRWSAPAMVVDRGTVAIDLIQTPGGSFLWADGAGRTVRILRSPDLHQWREVAEIQTEHDLSALRLIARADGGYDLIAVTEQRLVPRSNNTRFLHQPVVVYTSPDGERWTYDCMIARPGGGGISVSAAASEEGTVVAVRGYGDAGGTFVRWLRRESDGWVRSDNHPAIVGDYARVTYHPRWGWTMAWVDYWGEQFPGDPWGPFLARASTLDAMFRIRHRDVGPRRAGPPPGPPASTQPAVRKNSPHRGDGR